MELQTARVEGERMLFDSKEGFDRARVDGFFLIEQPADLHLDAGDLFATSFFLDRSEDAPVCHFTGYRSWTADSVGARQGYFCRDADQTEQFFLEQANWDRVFPAAVAAQAEAMRALGQILLKSVLGNIGVPRELWPKATGGAVDGTGAYHLTFNHFRSEVSARGLNIHKDSGWLTLLRSTEPGLEVQVGDTWKEVMPRPGHLIVNFGCAMEILTRSCAQPVAAVAHRVRQQSPTSSPRSQDRVSYGLFIDSGLDGKEDSRLYEYVAGELLDRGSPGEFVDDIVERTYEVEGVGLY